MPSLLLQKPSKTSKSKDHAERLNTRLDKWKNGEFNELILECRAIQNRFAKRNQAKQDSVAKRFSNLMFQGRINSALKLLSNESSSGVLKLNEKVIESLSQKHPAASTKFEDLLLQGPRQFVHPTVYSNIDGESIQKAAAKTSGEAGPSKLDADSWRRMLLSKSFGTYSTDLANAIATMAKIMCTELCEPDTERDLATFVACTLITLDKNPGVRPIGIGEVLRRIIGKAVMFHLKADVMNAAGNLQLCTGQLSGSEIAVHAMRQIFEEEETEAILLVDVSNAFNSMNRKVMIHNTFILCPTIAVFTSNCYQQKIRLFIVGGKELLSQEGTTQGDPIAMAIYGINLIPPHSIFM